jgi:valyl-tRNA synthetase
MRYIEAKVASSANYLNKIWNASRYILTMLPEDFKAKSFTKEDLGALEQWIINRLEETISLVTKNMDKYDFNAASSHLYNFVYDDFCSRYLEMSKVSLTSEIKEVREMTLQVLFKCLKSIIMMIYPYTPFIAEELYLSLPEHKESIMLESYPVYEKKLVDNSKVNTVTLLYEFIKDVRSYKIDNKLQPNTPVDLIIHLKDEMFDSFTIYLKRFTFGNNIEVSTSEIENKNGTLFIHDGGEIFIKEKELDEAAINKLKAMLEIENNEIKRAEKMLSNPSFIAKAPKEKVELEKEKLAKHLEAREKIEAKLKNI